MSLVRQAALRLSSNVPHVKQRPARWLIAGLLLTVACAHAPAPGPLPALPPAVDVGRLVPPAPAPLEVPATVRRYDDVRVSAGRCPGLPPGILVSPAAYAEQIMRDATGKRLALELGAVTRLRAEERAAADQVVRDLSGLVRAERAARVTDRRWRRWQLLGAAVAGGLVGVGAASIWRAAR